MNRRFRLTRSVDFERVRRSGKSFAHPLVVLIVRKNALNSSRFAVAAGRSVGKAVERNRAKRLLRAALQPLITAIDPGWEVILIARRPIKTVKCQEVQAAIIVLLKRARLIKEPDER